MKQTFRAITPDGRDLDVPAGSGLFVSTALYLAGALPSRPLCNGLGRCGQCRARWLSEPPSPTAKELSRLTPEEIEQGVRLSCLHTAVAGSTVALEPAGQPVGPQRRILDETAAGPFSLAVDLGTTSIHWHCLDADGRDAASGRMLNPQLGAGSEIMSRLALALAGHKETLADSAQRALRDIVAACPSPVQRIALAANPAMACLLFGLDPTGLAAAPYRLDYAGGDTRRLAPDLPPIEVLPMASPFIGGDAVSGLAAVRFGEPAPQYPFLLADLGTNAEFLLAGEDGTVLAASVPMGPALEGVGLSCGMPAAPGAVVSFSLTPQGLVPRTLGPAGTAPVGLAGTGALSLTAHLRRLGLLDETGAFGVPTTGLAVKAAARLTEVGDERGFEVAPDVLLLASDIEELLKVKAVFSLACHRLARAAGLTLDAVRAVLTAGAFGEHVSPQDLIELGFLPGRLAGRIKTPGNTALAGACRRLTDPDAPARMQRLAAAIETIDLTADPDFQTDYLQRMRFAQYA